MQITFTKQERGCETVALRDDGVRLSVPNYSVTLRLPHDLAHYAVEDALGLADGFWGRIAEGAVFRGMQWREGRRRPHAGERSRALIRANPHAGTEAEVLVYTFMRILEQGLDRRPHLADRLLREVDRPGRREPWSLPADEVARICASLRRLQSRWDRLPVGDGLTVAWPACGRGRRKRRHRR
jgi:hypothetical protein